MSFCLCVEIYVVSFLYLDTMTEYQSEVMSFLFCIIRICQISISTLSRHFIDHQIVFSCIKSKSYIYVDECIEVTFSMFVVYGLRKNKSSSGTSDLKIQTICDSGIGIHRCLLSFVFYLFVLFFCNGVIPLAQGGKS